MGRAGNEFAQHGAGAGQAIFCVLPIAAVHPQFGNIDGGNQRAGGAAEAGKPVAAFPAGWQVFGKMRVGGGDNPGVDVFCFHGGAQGSQALGIRCGHFNYPCIICIFLIFHCNSRRSSPAGLQSGAIGYGRKCGKLSLNRLNERRSVETSLHDAFAMLKLRFQVASLERLLRLPENARL